MKVTKITAEEAEAFRARVREQNEERARWVVIDADDFIREFQDWTSCEVHGHIFVDGHCSDCGASDG